MIQLLQSTVDGVALNARAYKRPEEACHSLLLKEA